MRRIALLLSLLGLLMLATCKSAAPQVTSVPTTSTSGSFSIISGSENQIIWDQLIEPWCAQQGYGCQFTPKGSVDIMLTLQSGAVPFDAAWPANDVWRQIGDTHHLTNETHSIFRSTVVLAVRRSIAERLGWIDKPVKVADILAAAESKQLSVWMTSATQSNSGASVYLAFLNSFAGNDPSTPLTMNQLNSSAVQDNIKKFLATVDRSSESTGFLADRCVANLDRCQGVFIYEALLIEINQKLVSQGKEPFYAIYPTDGLSIADSPLSYVDHGDSKQKDIYDKLIAFLSTPESRAKMEGLGRRAGAVGLAVDHPDAKVFNKDWGIDLTRVIEPVTFPTADVVNAALVQFQTGLRKGSFTVYCLDFSPSMNGNGGTVQLKEAMNTLLDQTKAAQYLLQASPDDLTYVLPFSERVLNEFSVKGNSASELLALDQKIDSQGYGSGTGIFGCAIRALEIANGSESQGKLPAVVLMTDGESNAGPSYDDLARYYGTTNRTIPIYGILFGSASNEQVHQITDLTQGDVYDGRTNLINAFRKAKGQN